MRLSTLFTKTKRDVPANEPSKNAQLLIRAGYIDKEMAGVYSFLPLGVRVLRKVEQVIREEMNAINGQEVLLTTLQNPEIWQKSGRWVDEEADPMAGLPWFKTKLANGNELGIGNTHEEPLANIMRQHVSSYKDLPVYVYQIQNKFRNELRAKSGLMRGREFLMKDLYSFTRTEAELEEYYEKVAQAYFKIFKRVGIGDRTFRTFASGGAFSKFSDEFQTLSEAGEDTIYLDEDKRVAVNKEVFTDEVLQEVGLNRSTLKTAKAIEVGNIFKLGAKYAQAVGLRFVDEGGKEQPVIMGCYGIGLSRLMGTVAEVLSDDKGIVWPATIAPARVQLVALSSDTKVTKAADTVYKQLTQAGVEVLYDDRGESAGVKLADADLMGLPQRIVISSRTLEHNSAELKLRASNNTKLTKLSSLEKHIVQS